ncbi:VTC domain-containing protein [Acidaminobacterium chupaoyuni]
MAEYQQVFKRYEKKYFLTETGYRQMLNLLKNKMQQDSYGLHTICNLYYDTDRFDIIRASLEKPVYKEKLRLRSYGIPQEQTRVFVELKKKYDGVVYKRREPMPLNEAERFLKKPESFFDQTQIQKEISWFLRNRDIEAKAFIGYDRTAYFDQNDPDFRLTFDKNIRWRGEELDLKKGDWGQRILPEGIYLMELKIHDAIPLWMCRVLEQCHAEMASFSKYGACYSEHLMSDMRGKGEICA